ncbi:hypothetical protein ACHAWO_002771 [Cyclotella atomus]|uniref:SAP domain-containing protein n=1 Tax=Cyclotella atomus TaxID=382360 RepID=A0ABD3NDM1_9STRA
MSSYKSQYQQYQQSNGSTKTDSFITREMEEQVMASARASIDDKTVSRAISSLVTENERERRRSNNNANNQSFGYDSNSSKGNSLRDLAGGIRPNHSNQINTIVQSEDTNNSAWDTQQIAIASGVTTCLLSPIIIPIIHSLIPPILPFPSSISFEGAAFLGALAYILALGDPTDQSNVISKTTSGGMLGDSVEVTGAVSRIVGRTALQSVQMSAPRIKAVARAVVDYDSTVNTMEEMTEMQYQLSRRLLELESENDSLKREVALWNAVEDVSSAYKLEELKEIARVNGIRGYSSDGKTALLRRLVKERALDLDLSPYFQRKLIRLASQEDSTDKKAEKPAWCQSEKQIETVHTKANDENAILDFIDQLNFEQYNEDLELQTLIGQVKDRIKSLEKEKRKDEKLLQACTDSEKAAIRSESVEDSAIFDQASPENETENDDKSIAASVMSNESEIKSIHSRQSVKLLISKAKERVLDPVDEEELAVTPPVTISHTDDDGARLEETKSLSKLPFRHRNPAL